MCDAVSMVPAGLGHWTHLIDGPSPRPNWTPDSKGNSTKGNLYAYIHTQTMRERESDASYLESLSLPPILKVVYFFLFGFSDLLSLLSKPRDLRAEYSQGRFGNKRETATHGKRTKGK